MDKTVIEALQRLLSALEKAADAADNSVAVMNAYFVMEQEVDNAAGHCAQVLYLAKKEVKTLK